jgi:threonine dehydrogenase-like Zn-dependent dehydrogenase
MGAVEVAAQRSLELRREVYLRYQHQHLPTLRQCALHGARIDRGLAAAGDPEQQVYAESAQALAQRIDRRLLPRIEQEGRAGSSIVIASAFRAVVVIDCTGKPAGLVMASKLARPRGRVIVKTSPVASAAFDVAMATLLAHEIELTSVTAGSLASAAATLVSSRTDLEPMLTLRGRSADASRLMGAVRARQALCAVVV